MKKQTSSPSFRALLATLPPQANNIYYRDQIGNISTSDMKIDKDAIEMEVLMRFPIFGGWQSQFYLGYSVPSEVMLSTQTNNANVPAGSDRHVLKFDFFTVFEGVWVDEMEIKVVLPEGCTDIDVDVPYEVQEERTRRFTYLDSEMNGGRPVIILRAKNVVEEHEKQASRKAV